MYVGVIPVVSALLMLFGGIPHVRGGDPCAPFGSLIV